MVSLPDDGPARVGAIALPAGRRITPYDDADNPLDAIAWVTSSVVPDAGLAWAALSDVHDETGLVPVLLADDEDDSDYFFEEPSDVAEVDRLDAAELLAGRWQGRLPSEGEEQVEPAWTRERAPFTRHFPSLAPPEHTPLPSARLHQTLSSLPPARIGLIPARRPADALPVVGWITTDDDLGYAPFPPEPVSPAVWMAAVLRSWEDRFGARLLNIGPGAEIRLLIHRPPLAPDTASIVAAEHWAFADECDDCGHADIAQIITALQNQPPIWQFWWD
jgi:hypothetical protein